MSNASIGIFVLLLILAGSVFLQIFLSSKENKWFGLILPLILLLFSLLTVFSIVVYSEMSNLEVFSLIASTFLLSNIPTFIFLVIYFACRERFKRKKEIEKMNVQDL